MPRHAQGTLIFYMGGLCSYLVAALRARTAPKAIEQSNVHGNVDSWSSSHICAPKLHYNRNQLDGASARELSFDTSQTIEEKADTTASCRADIVFKRPQITHSANIGSVLRPRRIPRLLARSTVCR